ncbi:hypothetical protein RYH80_14125 [Halobaculum sp. MBLA0147]|uniref:hypothetical protein n=1 Tax=Halobaculum sp. MBLA0147 TaxID=3079934 RepID=UPI003524624B
MTGESAADDETTASDGTGETAADDAGGGTATEDEDAGRGGDSSDDDTGGDRHLDREGGTADEMRERGEAGGFAFRVFVSAPRSTVIAGSVVGLWLLLVAVGTLVPEAATALRTGDPVETVFQAFVGATITGVTLVVTLDQLVLSQELGAVGDQRERMTGALEFREEVAEATGEPAPAEPSAFLRVLVTAARDRARELGDTLPASVEDGERSEEAPPPERLAALAADVERDAERVREGLAGAEFGTFGLLAPALNFDYSLLLHRARRLQHVEADAVTDTQRERLDEVATTLELFGPAREHLKTLYFQWELIDLSRVILGAAVPALVTAVSAVLFHEVLLVDGGVAGVSFAVVAVAAAVAVASLPFLVLTAYVLRIATVTKRTLSIGPFTLRGRDDDAPE